MTESLVEIRFVQSLRMLPIIAIFYRCQLHNPWFLHFRSSIAAYNYKRRAVITDLVKLQTLFHKSQCHSAPLLQAVFRFHACNIQSNSYPLLPLNVRFEQFSWQTVSLKRIWREQFSPRSPNYYTETSHRFHSWALHFPCSILVSSSSFCIVS